MPRVAKGCEGLPRVANVCALVSLPCTATATATPIATASVTATATTTTTTTNTDRTQPPQVLLFHDGTVSIACFAIVDAIVMTLLATCCCIELMFELILAHPHRP